MHARADSIALEALCQSFIRLVLTVLCLLGKSLELPHDTNEDSLESKWNQDHLKVAQDPNHLFHG